MLWNTTGLDQVVGWGFLVKRTHAPSHSPDCFMKKRKVGFLDRWPKRAVVGGHEPKQTDEAPWRVPKPVSVAG